ncbi:FmdB family zinc ribbon protein [Micropruina sp.]|uniref:FmdB family zinc ribbon protein n=1 Tax=Micropruina sp. TaxID=2737536 RepID=UPI0039E4C7FE
MPTYQYRCQDCSSELEVVQKFTDDPLTRCPTCEGTLRKVFSAVGVVFKGSGFYATDSRAAKKTSSTSSSSTKTDSKPSEAKGGDSKSSGSTSSGAKLPATTSSSSSSGAPAA